MKLTQAILAVMAVFAVAGCKIVDIKDGKVPDAYLSKAKKLEGVYTGSFNGVPGELILTFEGSTPVFRFRSAQGSDILSNGCNSTITNLQKVYIGGKKTNPEVDAVEFGFNPGRCGLMVQGRTIYIDVKQKNGNTKLELSLMRDMQTRQVCQWYPGNPHRPPFQECHLEQYARYLYGRFDR